MSLKRNLRFSGTGFFFLKGFTVVFHRKKLFRFCFNYVFFLKGFTLFFPHKKSFFVFFLITFFFSSKNLHIFPHKKSFFVFFFKIIWVKLVHRDVTSYCQHLALFHDFYFSAADHSSLQHFICVSLFFGSPDLAKHVEFRWESKNRVDLS